MKNTTKDNKGITLIVLIITVILMLILTSVTTYTGLDTYKRVKVNKFVTQMQLLQTKVDDLVISKTTEELNNMQLQSITTSKQENAINFAFNNGEVTTNDINKYKVFTKDDILNILQVEDVENDILVNFETREIISTVGIYYKESLYHTQYKLPNGQTISNSNNIPRDLDFKLNLSIDGLNATVKVIDNEETQIPLIINGTLSYKKENDNYWVTVTNYTEANNSYEIVITESGNYIFKLQDNVDSENHIEKMLSITVTNKPRTALNLDPYNYGEDSEEWAYAQKDSVNYVWIPRFAYNASNNIKFIKRNSNIATDNTYIDNSWNIHDKFTAEDQTELTGIWIAVDSLKQEGINMVEILNSNSATLTEIY